MKHNPIEVLNEYNELLATVIATKTRMYDIIIQQQDGLITKEECIEKLRRLIVKL